MNELIKELREWAVKFGLDNEPEIEDMDKAYKAFEKILSRHAEPKEDSLEAWENEAEAFYKATGYLRPGKDPGIIEDEGYRERRDKAWKIWSAGWCYRNDHPTPDKAVEPLAVEIIKKLVGYFGEEECRLDHHGYCQAHMMETDCSVKKARQYLEALPDVKGDK